MRTVVLILRGCPAGWLGAYGNDWVVTPHLDRLASESVVFDFHISDCPEAAGACRAWLGGDQSLLEQLRALGIPTVLVRANRPTTDAPDWFYADWEEVFDLRPRDEDKSPLDVLLSGLPVLLDRLNGRPDYLLWIEIDRLLPPWNVSKEVFDAYVYHEVTEDESKPDDETEKGVQDGGPGTFDTQESFSRIEEEIEPWSDPPIGLIDPTDSAAIDWLATTFGSVITMLDTEIGSVLDQLRGRGLDRSATWIVTSDLGYPLGEHGQIGIHRPWLHEELVHLPLFVRLPGGAEAGRRIPAITQPADLAVALLDSFRSDHPHSEGILGLAVGSAVGHRHHAITALDLEVSVERSIRTQEWAYLMPALIPEGEVRHPQLFRKPEDRWEVNDLRSRHLDVSDELEAVLRKEC
jgi:arylsulfatase A-like enzyme